MKSRFWVSVLKIVGERVRPVCRLIEKYLTKLLADKETTFGDINLPRKIPF